jgi:mannose/fructose-specific phosphotransferase system component IIA
VVIAGVNLPMLLKALGNRCAPLDALAEMLIDSAKGAIIEVPCEPQPAHAPGDPDAQP